MKVKGGYFKKLLFVDLDKSEVRVVPLSDDFCLQYIGGRGIGIKLMWDNLNDYAAKLG